MTFSLKIKPTDPKDAHRRSIAIHEAAHCILAAYMGAVAISPTIYRRGISRMGLNSREQVLVVAPAGYFANLKISLLLEAEARSMSITDFRTARIAVQRLTNPARRARLLQDGNKRAEELVHRLEKEIKEIATLLEAKETLTSEEFDEIGCVVKIRDFGIVERKTEKKKGAEKKGQRKRSPNEDNAGGRRKSRS